MRIVVTGHIDHGKSTLIARLKSGSDPASGNPAQPEKEPWAHRVDTLSEEREGCLTIESSRVPVGEIPDHLTLIDVPGHDEFLDNMVTGASQADAAILVIAADDGPGPQTWMHLAVLSFLQTRVVAVVVSKMDLVGFSQRRFDEIVETLAGHWRSILQGASFIPTSIEIPGNILEHSPAMPWYHGPTCISLCHSCSSVEQSRTDGPAVMPIQDVYPYDGGMVPVGRLISGCVSPGDRVHILPSGTAAEVKALAHFPHRITRLTAGQSGGLILGTVPVARGDIVVNDAGSFARHDTLRVDVLWLGQEPLLSGTAFTCRCATQERTATIHLLPSNGSTGGLPRHTVGLAELRADRPMVTSSSDICPELSRMVLLGKDKRPVGACMTRDVSE